VILFVECGYKYKFFGADAIVAAKVLGIMCLTDKNFYVASVPTTRLDIHMERFIVAGYKVCQLSFDEGVYVRV
jgi:DNA mismatch repair protein MSH3